MTWPGDRAGGHAEDDRAAVEREAGRREVYLQIVQQLGQGPFVDGRDGSVCVFCREEGAEHRPGCVWVRAWAAVEADEVRP